MAKMKDAQVKETSGAYVRLFGNKSLGELLSRVHSTVISSGIELEKMILAKVEKIDDLDEFLKYQIMPKGIHVASKKIIKKSSTIDFSGSEPDFMVFKRHNNKQHCYIVEVKDGHTFDTKKARAEHASIHSFSSRNVQNIPYIVSSYFCAFNQNDKEAIHKGFKKKINLNECLTGREFCELLEIDYDEIVKNRNIDQEENFMYFLRSLLEIAEVKEVISKLLHNNEQ